MTHYQFSEVIGERPRLDDVIADRNRRYLQRRAEMIALLCDQNDVDATTLVNDCNARPWLAERAEAKRIAALLSDAAKRDAIEARLIALALGSP